MATGWRGRERAVMGWWLTCTAIELLLVGKIDAQETPAGVVLAAIAAVTAGAALAVAGDRYALRPQALLAVPKLALTIVRDSIALTGAALGALAGRMPDDGFEEVPFEPGDDGARGAMERALAVAAASAGPNSIVVDVDCDRRVLLVHRLVR